jgi:hypothetical protein
MVRPVTLTALLVAACGGGTASTEIDASTLIEMRRSGCFGSCPVYSVRISGDGSVVFTGEENVRTAEATAQIPVEDVQALVDEMLDADFFDLQPLGSCGPDDVSAYTADRSSSVISLALGDQSKEISSDHGDSCSPAVLRSIEDMIDEVAGTARWVSG